MMFIVDTYALRTFLWNICIGSHVWVLDRNRAYPIPSDILRVIESGRPIEK